MSRFRFSPGVPGPREREPSVVSPVLFGKLPARADFVRRGDPSSVVDALDTLSQRALRAQLPARAGPLYRLVAAPPRGPHVFIGALGLSRDTVGRSYPLAIGRTASRTAADPDTIPAWPLRWGGLLDGAAAMVVDGLSGAPLEHLDVRLSRLPPVAAVQGRSPEIDAHILRLRALPAHTLWTRIWGTPDPERFALAVARLIEMRGPAPYGLRFCLPQPEPDLPAADAVAVWLAVCWHLLPRSVAAPTLLWTGGPPAALFMFPGEIASSAFRALLTGRPDPDRIAAIDDGPASARVRAASSLSSETRSLLENADASVADVLDHLHTLR